MQRRALTYFKFGDPSEVTELVTNTISTDLGPHQVLVRWLASPINPADINKIQGTYMTKAPLPAIAGSEAMGRIVKVGSSLTRFRIGEKVAILGSYPCWADLSIVEDSTLNKIDQRLSTLQGATLLANPPTAWIMLRMGGLECGDWIVQNSANSAVGRAVVQIAKEKGFHTINVVRNRPTINELKAELSRLGGDLIWTEEEAKSEGRAFKGRPKLALNGVGGKSCLQISNLLARGGMLITYGGMGRAPHEISTSSLVFNNIRAVGFIKSAWTSNPANRKDEELMMKEIQEYFIRGILTPPPMDVHPLENYAIALRNSMDGKHAKQIFVMAEDSLSKL